MFSATKIFQLADVSVHGTLHALVIRWERKATLIIHKITELAMQLLGTLPLATF
jgi:hypothetical protein